MESSPYQCSPWPLSPCFSYCFEFPKPHNFLEERKPPHGGVSSSILLRWLASAWLFGWPYPLPGTPMSREHPPYASSISVSPNVPCLPPSGLCYHLIGTWYVLNQCMNAGWGRGGGRPSSRTPSVPNLGQDAFHQWFTSCRNFISKTCLFSLTLQLPNCVLLMPAPRDAGRGIHHSGVPLPNKFGKCWMK